VTPCGEGSRTEHSPDRNSAVGQGDVELPGTECHQRRAARCV